MQLAALFSTDLFGIENQNSSTKCGKLQLAALFYTNSFGISHMILLGYN
jgi:hypothetical protein